MTSKFGAHDKRLSSLEDAVKSLQQGQEEQAKQRQKDQESMAANFASLSSQFASSLESLQRAQQQQQEQLFQGMNELKAIVLGSRPQAEASKKRPASKAEPPMDWEPGNEL